MPDIEETDDLARLGLLGCALRRIAHSVTFETPVRLSSVGLLGHETIGAFTYIGPESEIKNARIGRFCSIARNVALGPPEHPTDWVSSHPVQYDGLVWFEEFDDWHRFANPDLRWRGGGGGVTLGHDVWIGRGAVIRRGVTIGDGAVVGANSFVNRDVAPYTIVAGQPARIIRPRFAPQIVAALHALCWWDWQVRGSQRLRFDDVPAFIDQFRDLRENDQLVRFAPPRWRVVRDGEKLRADSLAVES